MLKFPVNTYENNGYGIPSVGFYLKVCDLQNMRISHICVHVNLGCKIYVMVSKDNILHPLACYTVSVMGYGASENGGVFPDSEY